MALGQGLEANRARFQAAVLLQDQLNQPRTAAELFREYLAAAVQWQPLRPWAELRLARCLASLGQRDEARRLIEALTRERSVAEEALRLQRELDRP
jgi:predicted Zn-dependent protease